MKTTHQLAKELLAMPDEPLLIEGWIRLDGWDVVAKLTEYDKSPILVNRPVTEDAIQSQEELEDSLDFWEP